MSQASEESLPLTSSQFVALLDSLDGSPTSVVDVDFLFDPIFTNEIDEMGTHSNDYGKYCSNVLRFKLIFCI